MIVQVRFLLITSQPPIDSKTHPRATFTIALGFAARKENREWVSALISKIDRDPHLLRLEELSGETGCYIGRVGFTAEYVDVGGI